MNGRVLVRMPTALHEQLVNRADEQGVSLNQLVVTLLAGGVGFKVRPAEVERLRHENRQLRIERDDLKNTAKRMQEALHGAG